MLQPWVNREKSRDPERSIVRSRGIDAIDAGSFIAMLMKIKSAILLSAKDIPYRQGFGIPAVQIRFVSNTTVVGIVMKFGDLDVHHIPL